MLLRRSTRVGSTMALSFALFWAVVLGSAWAGPTRYDPKTQSFSFTYTYAALGENVYNPSIGAPQNPTTEEDARVRALVKAVSDSLFKATGGRAKIASLDRVDNVNNADLVISMTGNPGRAGWAITGAIEGKPGQMGLYYQYLKDQVIQDVVLSAAHELSHYLFALVDEYDLTSFPGGCPLTNPVGPGCLMDNYLTNGTRHGWYGRYCDSDHNSAPRQAKSCQKLVDEFFTQRNAPEPDSTLVQESQKENIIDSAKGLLLDTATDQSRSRRDLLSIGRDLGGLGRRFLTEQAKTHDIPLRGSELTAVLKTVVDSGSRVRVKDQGRLRQETIRKLVLRARLLALGLAKKSVVARRQAIRDELRRLAQQAPESADGLTQQEEKAVAQIARDAASQSADEARFEQLVAAAQLHIEAQLLNLRVSVANSATLGNPGVGVRNDQIEQLRQSARDALPGRPAIAINDPSFGVRRTVIIAPDPIDPNDDYILTQSGVHPYAEFRENCIKQFIKLVDRAKIVPTLITGVEQDDQPLALIDARFQQLTQDILQNKSNDSVSRLAKLQTILTRVVEKVKANQFENIIVFVPPGNLPDEFSRSLDSVREQVIGRGDVRLDLVLVGSATIPATLRDLALVSGGSILLLTDIDEVGALAQRLRDEQSAGAWVTLPFQGVLGTERPAPSNREQSKWFEPIDDSNHRGEIASDLLGQRLLEIGFLLQQRDRRLSSNTYEALYTTREALIGTAAIAVPPGSLPSDVIKDATKTDWFHRMQARASRKVLDSGPDSGLRDMLRSFDPDHVDRAWVREAFARIDTMRKPLETARGEIVRRKQGITLPNQLPEAILFPAMRSIQIAPPLANDDRTARSSILQEAKDFRKRLEQRLDDPGLKKIFETIVFPDIEKFGNDKLETSTPSPSPLETRIRLDLAERRLDEVLERIREFETQVLEYMPPPVFQRVERQQTSQELRRVLTPPSNRALSELREIREQNERQNSAMQQEIRNLKNQIAGQAKPGNVPTPAVTADGSLQKIRLTRFFAEGGYDEQAPTQPEGRNRLQPGTPVRARFEFIVGLSQPLPGVSASGGISPNELVQLKLFTDDELLAEAPFLTFDPAASSDTILVYRLELLRTHPGAWYNAALVLNRSLYESLARTNFTFSIASPRPNVQLVATLVQSPTNTEIDPPPTNRGTVRTSEGPARVEVQVLGGSSVTGASVQGFLQKIDEGRGTIFSSVLPFSDEGKGGDRAANDGVYTMLIPIDRLARPGEFRIGLLAVSTPESRNIRVEDPGAFDEERRKKLELNRTTGKFVSATAKARQDEADAAKKVVIKEQPALQFQRSTTLHFRVER